ncbi:MAG: hypothetical protein KF850_38990 [Labilithrix sp.]|nr:hypothetical protein [Labilithrix sp.]
MRARTATLVALVLAAVACAHEERRAPVGPSLDGEPGPEPRASSFGRPQYLVADPLPARAGVTLALGAPGVHGLVVDTRRVIVGRGEPRVAADATNEPIAGAAAVPRRFGGGFVFWTANAIYRADTFDAKLVPVTRLPDPIESIAFAPKALVARLQSGARWALRLPGGERAEIAPLGVADVHALDDGRAIAIDLQGAVFTSVDHGAHWRDVTAQLKGVPARVTSTTDELWLLDASAGASRLELDGGLSWFDRAPPDRSTELRAKDPRWHGSVPPLRVVFHGGAALDESTAIVVDSGDVARVDLYTGEVLSVVPGRLPPDAQCEAVPALGDVLFACASRAGGSAFVVSRTLSSQAPSVEQTFAGGGQFYAGDDGGLAYAGSCQGTPPSGGGGARVVCVRMPSGAWEELDVAGLGADGGAPDVSVARWVPRADGHVVAVVTEPSAGIYDPRTARFQPIADEARDLVARGASLGGLGKGSRFIRIKRLMTNSGVVDGSWSFGAGDVLRGWHGQGESVEIVDGGRLVRSPYAFEVVFAGAMGLGRSKDGRLYQSSDHGASWVEVAAPPSGAEAVELLSCTSAGCDLGAFYRVGWSASPPRVAAAKVLAAAAPEIRPTRAVELSCRARGEVSSKFIARTDDSPDDLGLGAARLPVADERHDDWGYLRSPIHRGIVSPIHEPVASASEATPSIRALLSGFATSSGGDVFTVTGPNKSALSLRRGVSYVGPFDPQARIVRASIAMSDVVAAGRRAGMTSEEILVEDFTESAVAVPLTPWEPGATSELALHNVEHGLVAILRGERSRLAIRASQTGASVISGVALPQDEHALLEVDPSGASRVFKVGVAGAADLFELGASATESFYPANPDALAVGPKGELAILRTPSGSDPPSTLDPAFVVVPSAPPSPLAPWSELRLADDPACKAEAGGFRATLQISAPWIRIATPELRVSDAPMLARVRWTPRRVCLEGLEVSLPDASLRVPQTYGGGYEQVTFATWLVGKGGTFARVGVTEGIEWRQALDCSLAAP